MRMSSKSVVYDAIVKVRHKLVEIKLYHDASASQYESHSVFSLHLRISQYKWSKRVEQSLWLAAKIFLYRLLKGIR